jgi:hypothetical protein
VLLPPGHIDGGAIVGGPVVKGRRFTVNVAALDAAVHPLLVVTVTV